MSNYILDPTPPTFSNNFRYILDATPLRYLLAQTTLKYTLNGPMQQLRTTFLVLRFSLVRSTSNVALNATRLLVCNFLIAMEICHPPCQLEKNHRDFETHLGGSRGRWKKASTLARLEFHQVDPSWGFYFCTLFKIWNSRFATVPVSFKENTCFSKHGFMSGGLFMYMQHMHMYMRTVLRGMWFVFLCQ